MIVALTRPTLASEGQVVVAGNIVPLAILMPDHHHTVFSRIEVVVRLVWSPVFIDLSINMTPRYGLKKKMNKNTQKASL